MPDDRKKLTSPTAGEIQHWPLDDQCLYLGIRTLRRIDRPTPAYPETWLLDQYKADGWAGLYSEWRFIMTFFKLLCEPNLEDHRLYTHNFIYLSPSAGYKDNANISLARICNAMVNFESSTTGDLLDRFFYSQLPDEFGRIGYEHARGWMPSLFLEFYHALGKDKLREILEKLLERGETRRFGWPDLTIMSGGTVKFVEVKQPGENLTLRQVELWRDVILPLGLDAEIVVVGPVKKDEPKQDDMWKVCVKGVFPTPDNVWKSFFLTDWKSSGAIVTFDERGIPHQIKGTVEHPDFECAASELHEMALKGQVIYSKKGDNHAS